MKRIRLLTLIAILALVLCACGSKEDKPAPTSAPKTTEAPTAEVTKTPTAEPTAEITAEPTVEPTQDITAEVTETPTEEPTPEVQTVDTWTLERYKERMYADYCQNASNYGIEILPFEEVESMKIICNPLNTFKVKSNGIEAEFTKDSDNIVTIIDNNELGLWATNWYSMYKKDNIDTNESYINLYDSPLAYRDSRIIHTLVKHNVEPKLNDAIMTKLNAYIDDIYNLAQFEATSTMYENGYIVPNSVTAHIEAGENYTKTVTGAENAYILFNPATTGILVPQYISADDAKDETAYTYVENGDGFVAIPKEGFDILTYAYDSENKVWHLVPDLTITVNFGFETADGTIVTSGQ